MSTTRVIVPTCPPIVLPSCRRCASARFPANGEPRVHVRSVRAGVLNPRYRDADDDRVMAGADRSRRPAWQSPYGPPPCRSHRGRWAPVPGRAGASSALRRAQLRDRCD